MESRVGLFRKREIFLFVARMTLFWCVFSSTEKDKGRAISQEVVNMEFKWLVFSISMIVLISKN